MRVLDIVCQQRAAVSTPVLKKTTEAARSENSDVADKQTRRNNLGMKRIRARFYVQDTRRRASLDPQRKEQTIPDHDLTLDLDLRRWEDGKEDLD